jgi:hypothetical protein
MYEKKIILSFDMTRRMRDEEEEEKGYKKKQQKQKKMRIFHKGKQKREVEYGRINRKQEKNKQELITFSEAYSVVFI